MASPQNLLTYLRARTAVDCDTLDVEIARELGPFEDCTSNQVIAFNELNRQEHRGRIQICAGLAKKTLDEFHDVGVVELAVEIAMISLSLRVAPYVRGSVHVQTNPFHVYSTQKTIENARRIICLTKYVDPTFNATRICVKVPSSWEGLQACRVLETEGIATLATTLFTRAQATLAGEVGCQYIAPYVHELRVQMEPGYEGNKPLFDLCTWAQQFYKHLDIHTKVLPASLTSIADVVALAGVNHLTIAPRLLRELASTDMDPAAFARPSLFDDLTTEPQPSLASYLDHEDDFRMAVTLEDGGIQEAKLAQAISIFCQAQRDLEGLMKPVLPD